MMRNACFLLPFLLLLSNQAFSNISVAPISLYLNTASPSDELTITNTTNGPLMIRLDLKFGYPVSDSLGNVHVTLYDNATYNERSCISWIYLYPRRFILYPNQTRTVRVIARPPSVMADGEYWCRLVIESEKASSVDPNQESKKVNASITVNFNLVIPIFFRKGDVKPDVTLQMATFGLAPDKVVFFVDTQPTTRAAYLGNIICQVWNASGSLVKEEKSEIAVYVPLRKRFEFERSQLPPGEYRLKIIYNTDRPDERGALYAEPRSFIKEFTIR